MPRSTISCAIVVLNEERNIADCLETARWMDEIVVVDAYSRDNTVAICRQYTEKVFQRPWRGFGDQKNFAIDQAGCDWVFILDADERIPGDLRAEIEPILRSGEDRGPVAYYVPRKNYYFGRWVKTAGLYPDHQLRLCRRGIGHLDDAEPHNRFVCSGESSYLASPLDHYTEQTIADRFKKLRNFTSLAAQERGRTKRSVSGVDLIGRPIFTFYKYYVARRGFCDGMSGFLFSAFSSMYTFVKYAKLWEQIHMRDKPNSGLDGRS